MKWKCSNREFVLILIIIILIMFKIFDIGFAKIDKKTNSVTITDTTYNHIVLDSIRYEIQLKDSVIYNIRYEYETEYIKAENLDDSSAVELFKRLCTDDSLYGRDNNY